jgi:protein SCO1/2
VLVPGYFGCPMLCGQVQSGLLDSLKTVAFRNYRVVCLSIDPRERPDLARQKRQAALSRGADWRFVTGTPDSIGRLCQAVGFQFRYDRRSDQFAHPAGIVVPHGRRPGFLVPFRYQLFGSGFATSFGRRRRQPHRGQDRPGPLSVLSV